MLAFFLDPHPEAESLAFFFIRVELRTGLTFAKSALESRHQERRDRNQAQARRAYDALLYFIPKSSLTPAESDAIKAGLAKLKSELVDLEEIEGHDLHQQI